MSRINPYSRQYLLAEQIRLDGKYTLTRKYNKQQMRNDKPKQSRVPLSIANPLHPFTAVSLTATQLHSCSQRKAKSQQQ
ncbi:hypothetical protein LOAG_02523 [Loa loa]|uniref:Uncharacterized protein n=1 Tax=Loa loa TaxID=7209 RepID=A0A1S0U6H7_LOALO|nr:hypothetical protein LOAG_02523 [Loa loa]EFO25966.1 hypothetical protein LOAG_02523 [Loa loa]